MDSWKAVALILGGILVGVVFAKPETSSAVAPQQFKECVWYCGFERVWKKPEKLAGSAKPVPPTWLVVNGSMGDTDVCAMLCR